MKRFISVSLLVLLGYLLQTTLFPFLSFTRITPNFLIVIVVSFAIMRGRKEGAIIGFFAGLLCDIFFGNAIGFYALLYTYIGFLNGYIHALYFRENVLLPIALFGLSDGIYNFCVYVITYLLRGKTDLGYYFMNIILPELIYTTILGLFIYKGILVLNNWLEADEKEV